ncbi:MAG: 23S rRNA (guanosine(2251)-2'-O)-methyltransferase RlmB [Gammaproteobacteria bacterium]|nr:23S rRNA (guanosine(2251)-2'-O)-methyltransferase RlmB [Gammaproteobacteria bacterium]
MSKHKNELIYGIHAVESALKHRSEDVLQLWVVQGRKDNRVHNLLGLAKKNGVSMQTISADKMKKKCADATHQGVAADLRVNKARQIALEDVLAKQGELLLLILDEVQDPHNIGACLRTADAAGVDAVIVSKNRSPGITAVVRKVACGAADTVPFVQVSNLARAMEQLRDNDVWIVGTAGETDASLYDIKVGKRTALVMGAEGKGMRRLTRENCDELVYIPMRGSVESLNVSVATGVSLFEIRRKIDAA